MPAPGEQHLNTGGKTISNPFDEGKLRISEYTAQEIATLSSRLEKQLGPEYISSRAGPSGQKVHYLAAEKCIQLANEVFGFNGWSSQIMECQVDFVDENSQTLKVSLGLSVIVRVTLRDGTFHEDVGYGHIENCKGKAAAFEKAKKEGTTDGLKRALRNFGNVLGNCIYDKEYLKNVVKVKAQPAKWDVEKLYRHSSFVPLGRAKEEVLKAETVENGANGLIVSMLGPEESFDDEFGDFDEADFSVANPELNPDEIVLPAPVPSHHFNGVRSRANGAAANLSRPPAYQAHPMAGRLVSGDPNNMIPPQPQTPNASVTRSTSGAPQALRNQNPQQQQMPPPVPQPIINGRILNQPSRNLPPLAPDSPALLIKSSDDNGAGLPPQGAGFFSARAATMLPDAPNTRADAAPQALNHLPTFNPHAESPSIRKTPGVDHNKTRPLTRDLKHVPGCTQPEAVGSGAVTANGAFKNVVNPQLDAARRIGVPGLSGFGGLSPMGNRNGYKPPTVLKRPVASGDSASGRIPLTEMPSNGPVASDTSGDIKRQRIGN